MVPHADALTFKTSAELLRRNLPGIAGNHNTSHEKSKSRKVGDELHGVVGIGYTEIGAHLLVFDITRINCENDLGLILERLQKTELNVRIVSGETACRMEVVHQLAAELEIEFTELARTAANLISLLAQVLFVVESQFGR